MGLLDYARTTKITALSGPPQALSSTRGADNRSPKLKSNLFGAFLRDTVLGMQATARSATQDSNLDYYGRSSASSRLSTFAFA